MPATIAATTASGRLSSPCTDKRRNKYPNAYDRNSSKNETIIILVSSELSGRNPLSFSKPPDASPVALSNTGKANAKLASVITLANKVKNLSKAVMVTIINEVYPQFIGIKCMT